MIISRTPFRVSLFGGGTDYPQWYRENGGSVLGFAINHYCYITMRHLPPFFDHKHRIVYSRIETVSNLEQIEHPAVRAILNDLDVKVGLEIHHDGDLPARSGLGSSSSFTVGLLNALYAMKGQMTRKHTLATEALRIEQDVIKENVGSQDQVWAAYGGFNRIDFSARGFNVSPMILPEHRSRELLDHLVIFFTGFSRIADTVAKKKIENLAARKAELTRIHRMVDEAADVIGDISCPITDVGDLLHEAWSLKRSLSPVVSNSAIDDIYAAGRAAGALGGKLLGAGSGGFFLFFIPPERREALRTALQGLIEVAIDIDREGSRIVLFEPGGFTRREGNEKLERVRPRMEIAAPVPL